MEENIPQEKLDERETFWIAFYDTYNSGYNSTLGGTYYGGLNKWQQEHPEEARKNALNGLEGFRRWCKENPEEWMKIHDANSSIGRAKTVEMKRRPCECIELHRQFKSLRDAERWSKTSENPNKRVCGHSHIAEVCKGLKKTCGGYHWKYISKNRDKEE